MLRYAQLHALSSLPPVAYLSAFIGFRLSLVIFWAKFSADAVLPLPPFSPSKTLFTFIFNN